MSTVRATPDNAKAAVAASSSNTSSDRYRGMDVNRCQSVCKHFIRLAKAGLANKEELLKARCFQFEKFSGLSGRLPSDFSNLPTMDGRKKAPR